MSKYTHLVKKEGQYLHFVREEHHWSTSLARAHHYERGDEALKLADKLGAEVAIIKMEDVGIY